MRGGGLRLLLDGTDRITAVGLQPAVLKGPAAGADLAAKIEGALIKAATAALSAPQGDSESSTEARWRELSRLVVRWDAATRRFAISSGRRGPIHGEAKPSSVEVLALEDGGVDMAVDLGLSEGEGTRVPGRLSMVSEEPVAQAMVVDVRLDVWARSQLDLAALLDGLSRRLRGRGGLPVGPALLAADAREGDTRLRLLPEGEPTHRVSLAHLEAGDEAGDSLEDRAGGALFTASGVVRQEGRIRFGASGTLTGAVCPTPLVPPALDPGPIAPRGLALAVGLVLSAAGQAGKRARLASLTRNGTNVLRLDIVLTETKGQPFVDIVATAATSSGAEQTATPPLRVPAERLRSPRVVHAAVIPSRGAVELSIDGAEEDDALSAEVTAATPGASLAGPDMTLVLGGELSDTPFELTFVHLFGEPLGPFDARLRRAVLGADRWAAGRRIRLAQSDDGLCPGGARFEATVVSVDGDAVTITPPVEGRWPRGRTVVFAEEHLIRQTAIRRKDDLAGQTFRATVDYRVSAVLEDEAMARSTPLVTEVDVQARARLPSLDAAEGAAAPG